MSSYSLTKIAKLLDISFGTVKRRLQSAQTDQDLDELECIQHSFMMNIPLEEISQTCNLSLDIVQRASELFKTYELWKHN